MLLRVSFHFYIALMNGGVLMKLITSGLLYTEYTVLISSTVLLILMTLRKSLVQMSKSASDGRRNLNIMNLMDPKSLK